MKLILLFAVVAMSAASKAQITVTNDDVQERAFVRPLVFDSLSDLCEQKKAVAYKQYIGYKLWCLPLSSNWQEPQDKPNTMTTRDDGVVLYSDRTTTITEEHTPFDQTPLGRKYGASDKHSTRYSQKKEKYERQFTKTTQVYKPVAYKTPSGKTDFKTDLSALYGTFFTILDIQGTKRAKGLTGYQPLENAGDGFLNLKFTLYCEADKDTVYWLTRSDEIERSNWLLKPYYDMHLKKVGQIFNTMVETDSFVDINTGKAVLVEPADVWYCDDVRLLHTSEHRYVKPYFLLIGFVKNAKIRVPFDAFELHGDSDIPMFMTPKDYYDMLEDLIDTHMKTKEERVKEDEERRRKEEEALKELEKVMIAKWGAKYGKMIANGQVVIGMTKKMCMDAWGEPISINQTTVKGLWYDQWVYGYGSYLYFNNGKLTMIQNQ